MRLLLLVLILTYSVCFYSPSSYGTVLNSSISIVYWGITLLYLYKYRRKQLFCFELFFSISFYLCSFLTLGLLPIMDAYESRAFIEDPVLISRAYILSLIGYLCYVFGLVIVKPSQFHRGMTELRKESNVVIGRQTNNLANLLCLAFILLMFINGGARMFTMYSDTDLYSSARLSGFAAYLTFAIITYIVSIVTNFAIAPDNPKNLLNPFGGGLSILFVINTIVLVGTFLLSGYRSNAIQILIPLVIAYQYKFHPIKPVTVLIILATGALLMFFIGMTRSGDAFDTSSYSTLTYLRDFKSSNAATLYLINYVDSAGPTYGSNMLFPILSIIPGLQALTSLFVDIRGMAPVSSALFTMAFSSNSGFGTNIIGDLYYTFGFPGVVVLMLLYGRFLSHVSNPKNYYGFVMLLVFSGNAMFAPRVEYCYIIRSIAWSVIFLFLLLQFTKATKTVK